jgi:peptidoglycan/xylan/chitin deacetylase (PgdA/CDA1 family)
MHALAALIASLALSLTGAVHTAFLPSPVPPPALPTDTSGAPLRIPIIIYHTIATGTPKETKEQEHYSTDPELLSEQLDYLDAHGYTTVTMHEVADMMRRGTTSPIAKPVALTFDDGWETEYKNAVPLLRAHHAKATFYIFPNPISKDPRFMTWEQLGELRDDGFEIADHSYTHPLLSKLSAAQLHHELYDSKQVLEQKLGITITDFASPFGYTSDAVVAELKADGYETGRTTWPGMTHAATSSLSLTGYLVHKGIKDFAWAVDYTK